MTQEIKDLIVEIETETTVNANTRGRIGALLRVIADTFIARGDKGFNEIETGDLIDLVDANKENKISFTPSMSPSQPNPSMMLKHKDEDYQFTLIKSLLYIEHKNTGSLKEAELNINLHRFETNEEATIGGLTRDTLYRTSDGVVRVVI